MKYSTRIIRGVIALLVLASTQAGGCVKFARESTVPQFPVPGPSWLPAGFDPSWADVTPTQVLNFTYDGGQSSEQNGADLASSILALVPGQKLSIGPGTYTIVAKFDVVLQGTASAPIWVEGSNPLDMPVITRPDANQNDMNVGEAAPSRYVCFRWIEFTGGDDLIKLYNCTQIWIDQCYIHDGDGVGIAANSYDTSYLNITRNEISQPGNAGDTGEGMYLGGNFGAVKMTWSVIALNWVHDTYGSTQGDGIEIKQGSHHNWIVGNLVHDTNYPCILAYGTYGNGENVIESNILHNSNDNTLQVQGEAIVRNNLIMAGTQNGFFSMDHQDGVTDLEFVHNTIITSGPAATLRNWSGKPNMVFANNAVYSELADSINFANGSSGVAVSGNVVVGSVQGISSGFVFGNGLGDFVNATWNASVIDARPSPSSALLDRGDSAFWVLFDINMQIRGLPLDAGAYEGN
jgi:hypothetical protein